MKRAGLYAAWSIALVGCALKGDVRRVEEQVAQLRRETARADSARAVALGQVLNEIAELQRGLLDSLAAQQRRLAVFEGAIRGDLTEIQRQIVQTQELMGQSQQRLSELRGQMEQRARQLNTQPATPGDTSARRDTGPGPEELYQLAMRQLRGGSPQAARAALLKFLQDYPQHERLADVWFNLGESWAGTNGDSARVAYERVVDRFSDSPRAPAALYKLGLLAEQRGDVRGARVYYQRVVAGYPRSEEADLARTKLQARDR